MLAGLAAALAIFTFLFGHGTAMRVDAHGSSLEFALRAGLRVDTQAIATMTLTPSHVLTHGAFMFGVFAAAGSAGQPSFTSARWTFLITTPIAKCAFAWFDRASNCSHDYCVGL